MDAKEKLYDLTFLKTIAGDDIEGLKDIVDKFLNNTPEELIELEKAIDNQNRQLTSGLAHKLKANVKFFHIKHIFETLKEIENTCADDTLSVDFTDYKQKIQMIRSVYNEVFKDLKTEFD